MTFDDARQCGHIYRTTLRNWWPKGRSSALSVHTGALQAPLTATRGARTLTTKQDPRQDAGRRSPGDEGNSRRLALAKVPTVLVGAFAHASRAQPSSGLHRFT